MDVGPGEEVVILWCGNQIQHPGHRYEVTDDPDNEPDAFWCSGLNADGTAPYDPARAGYEQPTPAPVQLAPLDQLAAIAAEVKGHLSLHASYGPEAIRHPAPDWTAQLIYTAGDPPQPVAWFGTGGTLDLACQAVVEQIEEAVEVAGYANEPTQEDTP